MTGRFWERLAAASGLLYVLLLNVGDDVIAKGEGPELTASRSEIVEHVGDHFDRSQFLLGRGVGLVGVALLVLFFVALRSVLRQGDPRPGWLPTVVLAGGLLAVAAQLMAYAPHLVAHQMLGHGGLSPESAQLLYLASNGFFLMSWLGYALAFSATAAAAIGGRALPRWLGWSAAALAGGFVAGVLTLPGVLGFFAFFLSLIWFVAASVVLLRRTAAPARAGGGAGVRPAWGRRGATTIARC